MISCYICNVLPFSVEGLSYVVLLVWISLLLLFLFSLCPLVVIVKLCMEFLSSRDYFPI
jgi:hypothetical protein